MRSDFPAFAIQNGVVIDPANNIYDRLNVFIQDGVSSKVSRCTPSPKMDKIDATGLCIAPGFIDLHVHLREPGFEYKEDIESGSRAALAGGFTTVFCMPNTKPVNDCAEVTRYIKRRAKEVGLVNIFPVGAMSKGLLGREPADISGMVKEGVVAISDDGMCIQDGGLMHEVMGLAKKHNLLVIEHAEDYACVDSRESENRIIERDIKLGKEIGARIHITHLSTIEGLEMVRKAKGQGISVTCDCTPHHLLLTEDDFKRIGPNAKMKPPLRKETDRQALIQGLQDRTVDAIATDHAPHSVEEKKGLESAEFGVIGLETAFPVCMKLVHDGLITLERLVELLTIGPARVAGIRAGTLSKGARADFVVFDPDESYIIDAGEFKSKARNTPFDGWEVKGRIKKL